LSLSRLTGRLEVGGIDTAPGAVAEQQRAAGPADRVQAHSGRSPRGLDPDALHHRQCFQLSVSSVGTMKRVQRWGAMDAAADLRDTVSG
jgi:hypothetical protein